MEAINFRVRCVGPTPTLSLTGAAGGGERSTPRSRATAAPGSRAAMPRRRSTTATRCSSGDTIQGPAIIEEREATTVDRAGRPRQSSTTASTCASPSARSALSAR